MVKFNSKANTDFRVQIEERILHILSSAENIPNLKSALNLLSDEGIIVGDSNLAYVESVFSSIYKAKAKNGTITEDRNIDIEF